MREFAYTFACTPTLTTRRPPVYMALSWASALIILWSQVQVLVGPPMKSGTYRTHALRPVPTTWFTPLPITSPILWDQMGFLGLVPLKTPYQSKPYRNP